MVGTREENTYEEQKHLFSFPCFLLAKHPVKNFVLAFRYAHRTHALVEVYAHCSTQNTAIDFLPVCVSSFCSE